MMYQEMFEALKVLNEMPQEPHSFCFIAECSQMSNVKNLVICYELSDGY